MMLPILISVSVAPMSYFFWSAALTLVTARIARAAEISPDRRWMAGMLISLDLVECVCFFEVGALSAPHRIQHPPAHRSKKNAFRKPLAGASFSRRRVSTGREGRGADF